MANLKSLAKDTAIYGLSSIVGRFLNYLLVPLYTYYMPHDTGDYGISTNIYAYTALILVILTFGMETTLFRFANDERYRSDTVFSTAFATVGSLTAVFLLLIFGFIGPISDGLGYSEHPDYLLMMAVVVALDAIQALPFCYLRYQKRAIRFASLKMLFILINIGGKLLREMLSYSWPILILGIAGILNQVADKIIFPLVYPDEEQANILLGDYGSCVKIAMIMAMITQAFRYAYEPIVFAKSKDADKTEYYATAMKFFIIFTLLAFLCVMGVVLVQAHRQDHLWGLVLVGRLHRAICRKHPADPHIRLLGLCLGRLCRLWHSDGTELYHRPEQESYPLSDEEHRSILHDSDGGFRPDEMGRNISSGMGLVHLQQSDDLRLCCQDY